MRQRFFNNISLSIIRTGIDASTTSITVKEPIPIRMSLQNDDFCLLTIEGEGYTEIVKVTSIDYDNRIFIVQRAYEQTEDTLIAHSFADGATISARLTAASIDALVNPAPDMIWNQTTPNNVWSVIHNLGRKPPLAVVVSIDGVDFTILPDSAAYIDENHIEIGFSTPRSGKVLLG